MYKSQRSWFLKFGEDMDDFKKIPYSALKARIYIEVSALIVTLLQHTKVSPNLLTFLYAMLGPFSIALVFIDSHLAYNLVMFNFVFMKAFLDWSDGTLARITNKCSQTGAVLDVWGAHVNSVSFHACIGIFLFNQSANLIFLILVIYLIYIRIIDLKQFSHAFIGRVVDGSNEEKGKENNIRAKKSVIQSKSALARIYKILTLILDERARMVDSIIALLLLDFIFTEGYVLSVSLFLLILCAVTVKFVAGLYVVIYNKAVE